MKKYFAFLFLSVILFSSSCKDKSSQNNNSTTPVTPTGPPTINSSTAVMGFNMLAKVNGIWSGPVTSSTAMGNFPQWIVDVRPISAAQVSGKSELDSLNDIFLSFFIVYHGGQYKLAFRNGGFFSGMKRISYLGIDSLSENATTCFYRFSDFIKGKNRTYTELTFRNDSLYFKTYTNKGNTLTNPVVHMFWSAKRADSTTCQNAITNFSFPQKQMVKDFSSTFNSLAESIYYSDPSDPYKEANQPYLGQATVNYTFSGSITPVMTNKVLAIISAQPLIVGGIYQPQNMKFLSRSVVLSPSDFSFTFNYMHPGNYYFYFLYDTNGDLAPSSGDWISINGANSFSLNALGTQNAAGQINFQIP